MAVNTREARKEAERKRKHYFNNYYSTFCSLFDNSIVLENCEAPKRYILRVLREKGAIAYHYETKLYLPFTQSGIDIYGLPNKYILVGANGRVITAKPDEVCILRANDLGYAIEQYFVQQIEKIVDFDLFIEQNLDSNRTMTLAEVDSESTLLSLANEYEARRIGATVLYKKKQVAGGSELSVESTGATWLVDKALEARRELINETLSSIGVSVANIDKKERVQSMEVIASQGYAIDMINTLIDTFNYDSEQGGLSVRLKGNTSLYKQNEQQMKQEKQGDDNEQV